MDMRIPKWFEVNSTFKYSNGWYIGTRSGVNIGPYEDRETAKLRSKEISHKLTNTASSSERLALLRQLLHDEWKKSKPSSKPNFSSTKNEMSVRKGEECKTWFRSERFYSMDGAWFFSTREGAEVGPYATKEDAHKDERRLVKLLAATPDPTAATILIHEFKHRCYTGVLNRKT